MLFGPLSQIFRTTWDFGSAGCSGAVWEAAPPGASALDRFGTQKLMPENESEASRVGTFGTVCSLQAIGNPLGQKQGWDGRQS